MKRKFRVETTVITEHEIEIETDQFTEEFITEFERYMYSVDCYDDNPVIAHVLNIADYMARNPSDNFIEGYGYVRVNGFISPAALEDRMQVSVKELSIVTECQDYEEVQD